MPNFLSPKATTAVCQGYDSATGSLLGSKCLKNYCKIKAIDLIKQQTVDPGPKAIQQINFFGNLLDQQ